jgi:hypothetical protein
MNELSVFPVPVASLLISCSSQASTIQVLNEVSIGEIIGEFNSNDDSILTVIIQN